MYINKGNRFKFRFWQRFLGTSLTLFFVSLIQEYVKSTGMFIATAMFLGGLSVVAIYAGTKYSGLQKFFLSIGFVILVGLFTSTLLLGSCYMKAHQLCEPPYFESTIAVYFIAPLFPVFLYFLVLFLGSLGKTIGYVFRYWKR